MCALLQSLALFNVPWKRGKSEKVDSFMAATVNETRLGRGRLKIMKNPSGAKKKTMRSSQVWLSQ